MVQRNSDVLLRLINQLLDLAKLESGTMKIEKSNSDINSFIRAIAGSFESLARHKNVTLSVEIPSDRNQVVFDKDKLETILINLINNAIKLLLGRECMFRAACSDNSLTMIVRLHCRYWHTC
jgi:signal transduction histidine kinase